MPHSSSVRLRGVGARNSLITILANYACNVGQRGPFRLYCTCNGLAVTAMWAVGAVVCLLAMINFALLMGVGAHLMVDTQKGTVGVIMAALASVAFTHLARRRYARHGRFVLDGERGVLRRYRGKRLVGEFHFNDVRRVWTTFDYTDGVRLNGPPKWLQIAMSSGEIFRIAKGDPQELRPVCDAIKSMGLALG